MQCLQLSGIVDGCFCLEESTIDENDCVADCGHRARRSSLFCVDGWLYLDGF